MAFEESEYKDVKRESSCLLFARNAHPSNSVTFERGQSASVCCHIGKLSQKRRTLRGQQFQLMYKLVNAGFDVYGYATFTTPQHTMLHAKMADFVDQLQEHVHPLFPLRTVPLRIVPFSPTKDRIGAEQSKAFHVQQEAIVAWTEELRKRFSTEELNKRITEHKIR